MSYSETTPNLKLPVYESTDKPTYLGDWNQAMQSIDTGYGEVKTVEGTVNELVTTVTNHTTQIDSIGKQASEASATAENTLIKSKAAAGTVIFIGDSWGAGQTSSGTSIVNSWETQLKNLMGLADSKAILKYQQGCGWTYKSNNKNFLTLLQEAASSVTDASNVSAVIVAGGMNDMNMSVNTATLDNDIKVFVRTAIESYPNAEVIAFPMLWAGQTEIPQAAIDYKRVMLDSLANTQARYSQYCSEWLIGFKKYFGNDQDHTNPEGMQRVAQYMNAFVNGNDLRTTISTNNAASQAGTVKNVELVVKDGYTHVRGTITTTVEWTYGNKLLDFTNNYYPFTTYNILDFFIQITNKTSGVAGNTTTGGLACGAILFGTVPVGTDIYINYTAPFGF